MNKEKAEKLYYKILAYQMELVSTKDKYVALFLLDRIEKSKIEIRELNQQEYIDKTALISYTKYDSRVPAFSSNRAFRRFRTTAIIVIILAAICAGAYFAYTNYMANQQAKYEKAVAMMVTDYESAYPIFQELGNYEQSSTYASFCSLCIELKQLENSDIPVELSTIKSKIIQFDEYNIEVNFDNMRNIISKAESYYGTYWEGGGYTDSVGGDRFILGVKIDSTGGIKATSFRADGYLVDLTWSAADGYTMYYSDGELVGIDNKYGDYMDIHFYDDHIEYQALRRLSPSECSVYKK